MSILEEFYGEQKKVGLQDLLARYVELMHEFEELMEKEDETVSEPGDLPQNGPVFQKIPLPVVLTNGKKVMM